MIHSCLVCVFVLFCCVVLFVVGWQQHCRYSVIDAMVFVIQRTGNWKTSLILERLWSLWIKFGFVHLVTRIYLCNIACHEDRHDWSYVSFTFVSERKSFEFGAYDIVHELNEMSFGWCLIIYLLFCRRATYSSLTTFRSRMWSWPELIFVRSLFTLEL